MPSHVIRQQRGGRRIYKLIQDAFQQVFLGKKTLRAALDEAAEAANRLMRALRITREDTMARVARNYRKPSRRTKKVKRRACLRCDREFWSEGPHHRLCQTCRQVIAASPSPAEEYSIVSHHEPGTPDPLHAGRPWH
jgi:hypothetical protein